MLELLNDLNYSGLPLWRRVEHFVWLSIDFIIFYCFGWKST